MEAAAGTGTCRSSQSFGKGRGPAEVRGERHLDNGQEIQIVRKSALLEIMLSLPANSFCTTSFEIEGGMLLTGHSGASGIGISRQQDPAPAPFVFL